MIIIDKEFQGFLPQNDAETKAELEKLIIADGCRDPIVLWGQYKCDCGSDLSIEEYEVTSFSDELEKLITETKKKWNCTECNDEFFEEEMCERGIIIDGHHRYEICTRLNIPFQTIQKEFNSRYDVLNWMFDNQKAKRNLNNFERSEVALKLEEAFKVLAKENQKLSQGQGVKGCQNSDNLKSVDTKKEIAKKANVSHDTIHKAKTILNSAPVEVINAVRSGEMSVNQAFNEIKKPHVSNNSGENEWYTPVELIESARLVMGSIDLDPASSEIANKTVSASTFFSKGDDGLTKEWFGNVWMNPPYAQPLMSDFAVKIIEQLPNIKESIVLINNATETKWFQLMAEKSAAICFPKSRIKFLTPNGKEGAPLQGQAIIYFGKNKEFFKSEFSNFGLVLFNG